MFVDARASQLKHSSDGDEVALGLLNTTSQAVPALEVPAVASLLPDISVAPRYVSVSETVGRGGEIFNCGEGVS